MQPTDLYPQDITDLTCLQVLLILTSSYGAAETKEAIVMKPTDLPTQDMECLSSTYCMPSTAQHT